MTLKNNLRFAGECDILQAALHSASSVNHKDMISFLHALHSKGRNYSMPAVFEDAGQQSCKQSS